MARYEGPDGERYSARAVYERSVRRWKLWRAGIVALALAVAVVGCVWAASAPY